MIKYRKENFQLLYLMRGSVIPGVMLVSVPNVVLTYMLKWMDVHNHFGVSDFLDRYNIQPPAWTAFSGLLGLFLVFRLQQAYVRYYSGYTTVQMMMSAWFDTTSSTIALLRDSLANPRVVTEFKQTLIRLMSILNAFSLLYMQGDRLESGDVHRTFNAVELIGFKDLDPVTVDALKRSHNKAELVYHWIHEMLVHGFNDGLFSAAPGVISRPFTTLHAGLGAMEDGKKLGTMPFPFPYAQAGYWMLVIHWTITPMNMCLWTKQPETSAFFAFLTTFIFWSMHKISSELENPYGCGPNDVDCREVQDRWNKQLLMLIGDDARHLPHLRDFHRASTTGPRIRLSTANDFSEQFKEDSFEQRFDPAPVRASTRMLNVEFEEIPLQGESRLSTVADFDMDGFQMADGTSSEEDSQSEMEGTSVVKALQPEGTHSRAPPEADELALSHKNAGPAGAWAAFRALVNIGAERPRMLSHKFREAPSQGKERPPVVAGLAPGGLRMADGENSDEESQGKMAGALVVTNPRPEGTLSRAPDEVDEPSLSQKSASPAGAWDGFRGLLGIGAEKPRMLRRELGVVAGLRPEGGLSRALPEADEPDVPHKSTAPAGARAAFGDVLSIGAVKNRLLNCELGLTPSQRESRLSVIAGLTPDRFKMAEGTSSDEENQIRRMPDGE